MGIGFAYNYSEMKMKSEGSFEMKKLIISSILIVFLVAGIAQAIPSLQLDIAGGTYDLETETIISSGTTFTLYAYLIPDAQSSKLTDTYFLSMAVTPKIGPTGSDLGSYSYNGNTLAVTGDMLYGTPPFETLVNPVVATTDPGDLSSHGIFETYFYEYAFKFGTAQISPYNTQDRAKAGSPISMSGSGMYYVAFEIDTTNLDPGYFIHFDLYNEALAKKSKTDLDVNQFAPFSHDAQSNHKVPEPGMLSLLGLGLFGMAFFRRK